MTVLNIGYSKVYKKLKCCGYINMPPSRKYHPVVRLHLTNHKVPRGTQFAVFVLLPAVVSSLSCPISKLIKCNVDVHAQHYEGGAPIFVNSWSLPGNLVIKAIKSIDQHVVEEERDTTELIILFYAHCNGVAMDFGGRLVSIARIIRACNHLLGVRLVCLLGCNSGARDLPPLAGYMVIGFTTEVDYFDLIRFVVGVLNHYCGSRRMNNSINTSVRDAVAASYTIFIVYTVVAIFSRN